MHVPELEGVRALVLCASLVRARPLSSQLSRLHVKFNVSEQALTLVKMADFKQIQLLDRRRQSSKDGTLDGRASQVGISGIECPG